MNEVQQREMRVSLTAIKSFISTLLSDDDLSSSERKELYEIIDTECDRVKQIFTDQREDLSDADGSSLKSQWLSRISEADKALEQIAGLTEEQARQQLFMKAEAAAKSELALRRKILTDEAQIEADRQAKQVILNAIQRISTEYSIEATTSVIQLPSEDMKGKLIGREGRNIRTFEQVAGVDLVIDESPNTVVVSSFDPVRREIARITLMNLMLDGRIHPARIEELHEKAKGEVERVVAESGDQAAERAKISGIGKGILQTLGRLRFRASYAQNVLDHSVEVAELSGLLAYELGMNVEVARRAGLLHDIGKALGPEWDGPHAIAGMNYLMEHGETEHVTNAVGAHHLEIEPSSPEAQIVLVADAISASRPGARRESLDLYVKRVAELEKVANGFPGVERSYALQAGREIRLIVKPEQVSDEETEQLADEVAKKVRAELQFPGQIKVTVIRETRVQRIAK